MCNCINYKIRFALCSLAKEFPSFQSKTNGHRDISKGKPVLSQWRVKHYHPAFLNLYKQKNGADQYLNRNPNYPITQGIQFKKKGGKKKTLKSVTKTLRILRGLISIIYPWNLHQRLVNDWEIKLPWIISQLMRPVCFRGRLYIY